MNAYAVPTPDDVPPGGMAATYAFECDLDKDRPEAERAALAVGFDGEHLALGFSERPGDLSREVYLTPEAANDLTVLIASLLATAGHRVHTVEAAPEDAHRAPSRTGCSVLIVYTALVAVVAMGVFMWLHS